MAVIQLVDPKSGQIFDVDESEAESAAQNNRLVPATPEQVAEYDALKAQRDAPVAGRALAAGSAALATGARLIEGTAGAIESATGFGTAPGLEAEQGSEALAENIAPSAFTPESQAARQAFPGFAAAGALAPAVGLGLALAPVSGGVGGLLATEGIVGGVIGEAGSAALEERQMNARGALVNGVIGVGLGGLGAGASAAWRSLAGARRPLVETAEQAVNRRVPRALLEAGEDLADPETARRATEISSQRIDTLMRRIDEAASSARPPVANNPQAQQQALTGLADELAEAQPELAQQVRDLAELPRGMRWKELQALEASNPNAAAALDAVRNDAALWGDRAVAHGQALAAARAARGSGPGEFRAALAGIEDSGVRKLTDELSEALDDAAAIEAAQAFAPARKGSVGAAAEDFTDTDFEIAIKEIDEGKLKGRALQAVAEVAPGKRALMSLDAGDSLDAIDDILRQDVSFGVKVADFEAGAREFTPELIEAQRGWLSEQATRGRELADLIADARTKVESGQGFDTKGLGVEAINTIRTGLSRIEAATDAATRNIETDLLKREVDSLVKRVGASRSLDEGTQRWLMQRLRPYADSLREGLQDTALWGRNAELQGALNAGWHKLIEPFSRIQRQLYEMTGREYGGIGASAIERRANTAAIERAMASDKGRAFFQDMSQALEGLDDIAQARKAYGLSKLDRLDEMRAAIQNVRDQFNTATVLRIAEKRAGVPAKLSTGELVADTALDAAGMIPGVGLLATGARVARKAAQRLQPDLELTQALKDTATGRVFARNLRRFSRTQAEQLQDVGFTREMLPAPLRSALRRYGAPSSVGGMAPAEARDILVRKAARRAPRGQTAPAAPDPSADWSRATPEERAAYAEQAVTDEVMGDIDASAKVRAILDKQRGQGGSATLGGILAASAVGAAALAAPAVAGGETGQRMREKMVAISKTIERAGGAVAWLRQQLPGLEGDELNALGERLDSNLERAKAGLQRLAALVDTAFSADAKHAPEDMQAADTLEAEAERDLADTARALTDPAYAARWARQARGLPGTLERFMGPHATLRQAFAERRQAILDATRDPETLVGVMTDRFGDLPPEVGMQALQVAQYLSRELPPVRGATMTRPNGIPPDELEMRSWALKYETAVDPSSAFDDAKRGKLRHEQVRTLREVWPDRYEELRTATMLAMGEGRSSVTQRMRADLLFGFAEALDPAFSRRLSSAAAAAYAEQGGASTPGGAPTRSRIPGATNPGGLNALQLGASAPLAQ
jgi:hypothetical protein